MSDRTAQAVEVASIAVIGCCLLFFGWALVQNVVRFRAPAVVVLLLLGALEIASIRRNLAGDTATSRIRATRDAAFAVAIVLALTEAFAPQRWAIGACIASVEFGIVLELLARLGPA